MKPQKKKRGSVLITVGCFFLFVAAICLYYPNRAIEKKMTPALFWMSVGLPLVGLGSWRTWAASKKEQREKRDRLQSTFYRMIQEGNGKITVSDFAMEAQLAAQESQQYLDEKAKEFDAHFLVTEGSRICYQFETRKLGKHYLALNDSQSEA